jgi:hypothetical protein
MRGIFIAGLIALTISAPLIGCREDEKQGGKDAVREFLAEEKSKAQTERERFRQGRGEGSSYPINPFEDQKRTSEIPKSPASKTPNNRTAKDLSEPEPAL